MNKLNSVHKTKNHIRQTSPVLPKAKSADTPSGFASRCIISAFVCFLASFGKMIGFPSYMNVAAAVISAKYSPAALLGAIASYAVQGNLSAGAVQISAILVTVAMNIFFPYFSKNGDPIRLSLYTVSVTLILSCVSSAVSPDSFSVSMRIISSLMCSCVVYALAFVAERFSDSEPIKLSGLTAVYCTMIFVSAAATLTSCQLGIFNLGRVMCCAVIPACARKKRASGGAVMGALTAVSVTLCSSSLSVNTMLLAAAGLICSAFADFGRAAVAVSFMLSASAALATAGLNPDTFHMLADIIAGSVLFTAMPSGFPSRIFSKFIVMPSPADNAGQTASSRLTFAALTISDIKDKLAKVSDTVESRAEKLTLSDRVRQKACSGCRLHDECEKNGRSRRIDKEFRPDCGDSAIAGCIRKDELPLIISKCREEQLSDRAEAVKLREMRVFLREQLGAMSDILNDLSCRLSRRRETDPKLSLSAKNYFERQGFSGVRACVYIDENCCRHAEIYISGKAEAEPVTLTSGLCRVLDCELDLPGITRADRITKLEFDEIPPFSADTGCYTALGSDTGCSGDTIEDISCSAGERYILLSDGMGSGKRARLDSAMCVNLAGRMLRSGLSMTTSQRIINSVMRVKDWEESFATLDLLKIDLFSGRAEFLKSGAAPAYLCRDGGMIRFGCDSFPAGILSSCDPDISSCKLFDGDVIILATDGAPQQAVERSADIALDNPEADAQSLACMIGSECTRLLDSSSRTDDITVAVVKISRKECGVFN